jgi:hypothetical protein
LVSLHGWAVAAATAAGLTLERFSFSRRDVREGIDVGQTQAALHLERLTAHEFIVPLRAVGDGMISHYRLAWTPDAMGGGVAGVNGLGLVEVRSLVSAPALTPTATDTVSSTCTTPTCRDFSQPVGVKEQPVGGLSGSTPTGETTVNHRAITSFEATCRDFSISRGGDISPSLITSYIPVIDGDAGANLSADAS